MAILRKKERPSSGLSSKTGPGYNPTKERKLPMGLKRRRPSRSVPKSGGYYSEINPEPYPGYEKNLARHREVRRVAAAKTALTKSGGNGQVKSYKRRTKSGKVVTVKAHSRAKKKK